MKAAREALEKAANEVTDGGPAIDVFVTRTLCQEVLDLPFKENACDADGNKAEVGNAG